MRTLPSTDRHHFHAAQGWLMLGDWRSANDELENITPLFHVHPDVLALRWATYAKAGRHDMALEVARGLVELLPDDASWWLRQAESLRKMEDGGARAAFDSLIPVADRFADHVPLLYSLACYACQSGDLKAAWTWLERAMDKGGDRIKLLALDDRELEAIWLDIAEI